MASISVKVRGKDIPLFEKPTHEAVMNTKNIITRWMLTKVNLKSLNRNVSVQQALTSAVMDNPELMMEFLDVQASLKVDQTIMLATRMSLGELKEVKKTALEEEYMELHEKSIEVLGGTAEDFFRPYVSGSSSKTQDPTQTRDPETQPTQNSGFATSSSRPEIT